MIYRLNLSYIFSDTRYVSYFSSWSFFLPSSFCFILCVSIYVHSRVRVYVRVCGHARPRMHLLFQSFFISPDFILLSLLSFIILLPFHATFLSVLIGRKESSLFSFVHFIAFSFCSVTLSFFKLFSMFSYSTFLFFPICLRSMIIFHSQYSFASFSISFYSIIYTLFFLFLVS